MSVKKVGFKKITSMDINRKLQLPMTGMLCRFLATHFSSDYNIKTPILRQYTFDDDQTKTNILIQPHYVWNIANLQQRPALIVKRGAITPKSFAIGDGMGSSIQKGEYKNVMLQGTHTVFCINTTGGSAELLSEEVFQTLLEFSRAIQDDFDITQFKVNKLGDVSKLDESDEHFVIPITIGWTKQNVWRLKYDGPWLQDVGSESNIVNN